MRLGINSGVIFAEHQSGRVELTAQIIYSAVFEGVAIIEGEKLSSDALISLGLVFSESLCLPVILLEAGRGGDVSVKLAGKVGDTVIEAHHDYAIIEGTWYPLPPGSEHDAKAALATLGAGLGHVSFGQYLKILRPGFPFPIVDRASKQLTSENLGEGQATAAPANLNAKLFPYQETGYRWLSFMSKNDLGAILADEMGLGKTLQVIGLLLSETESGRFPNLVICPATIIENWRREILKFAPSLKVLIHRGSRRAGLSSAFDGYSVVITSYETATADISLFSGFRWNMVVMDEAQAVKNPSAQRSTKLRRINRRICVAISGTPVENTLTDLWSICDFVSPGQLGTLREFQKEYPDSVDSARKLEPAVSALMLRRRVADVAKDLPERIEIPVPLEMDDASATAYEQVRQEAAAKNPANPDFTSMVPLRVFCAHPWAADKLKGESAESCSPKIQRLLEILEEIFASGEKVLIFTSFQEVSDLLKRLIAEKFSVFAESIDGRVAVPDRQIIIDRFSAWNGGAALVLNPKAAGVGLNITAANHVIHYNLEWNPALEDQATARSFRRGQTRPVSVHRLYFVNTIEEVVNDRMERKRELSETAVIGTDGREIDMADMRRALEISPIKSK